MLDTLEIHKKPLLHCSIIPNLIRNPGGGVVETTRFQPPGNDAHAKDKRKEGQRVRLSVDKNLLTIKLEAAGSS